MAGNWPKVGKSAVELLDTRYDIPETILEKYGWRLSCAVAGLGLVACIKWGTSRPMASGIQSYFVGGPAGWFIGQFIEGRRANYLSERDATLRHYVELHPEDFPTPVREKFADVLYEWVPIR